jgi:hypothetical protein
MVRRFARLSTRCRTRLSFRTGNYRCNRGGKIEILTDVPVGRLNRAHRGIMLVIEDQITKPSAA